MLVQERRRDSVHAERPRIARRLDRLVKARVPRKLEGVVRDRAHDPVRKGLVCRVAKVDCGGGSAGVRAARGRARTEEVERALGVVGAVLVVLEREFGVPREGDLPRECARPDDDQGDSDKGEAEPAAGAAPEARAVEDEEADDERADDRAGALERRVDRARRAVKVERVHGGLVRVKVVAREEHGRQREHAPVGEEAQEAADLLARRGGLLDLDDRAVRADDGRGREEDERGRRADKHDDDEGQVRAGRDGGQLAGADVDGERDDGADEGAELEDGPEDAKGLALVLLERVGHHDTSLGGPEQRGTDAKDGACENEEPARALSLEAPERANVEGVAERADE